MAYAIHFDTLAYANKLKESGIPSNQAETQAEALAEILEKHIVTKHDLNSLKHHMDLKFSGVDAKFSGVDAKFSSIDAKFSELKAEMIKWVIGISAAQAAIIISLLKFIH
jgi:hypothetical protein